MDDTDDGRQVRPAAEWLREQRRGDLHDELSEQLQQLVAACLDTGKQGSLTLKLTIKPSDASPHAHLEVHDEVDVKPPKPPRPAAIFFADDAANLVRHDPRQQRLPLRPTDADSRGDVG